MGTNHRADGADKLIKETPCVDIKREPKDASKVAVSTIEDDWEGFFIASSNPFPTRPDLKGQDTIRETTCGKQQGTGAGTLRCTLGVGHGSKGRTQHTEHVRVGCARPTRPARPGRARRRHRSSKAQTSASARHAKP